MSFDEIDESRFSGIKRLYGKESFEKFKQSHLVIIGIGGVGSWVAESFARSGIGEISLIDLDDLCVTNINRQVHALNSTTGQLKVEAMKNRIKDISPHTKVNCYQNYLTEKNLNLLTDLKPDFIVDACDDFTAKAHMMNFCRDKKLPFITMGGAGGKTDPTQINVTDLSISQNDRLLARIRKKLRQDFSFPRENEEAFGLWAVWSRERAVYPSELGCLTYNPPGMAKNQDCEDGFGSASFVTGAFAFCAVSFVLKQLSIGLRIVTED